jgi:hypothetical protein
MKDGKVWMPDDDASKIRKVNKNLTTGRQRIEAANSLNRVD